MKIEKMITEDEAALYDRQIRLWGVDAQKKLLSSRILLININGVAAEIAKNLVLGGIYSLTLLDSKLVSADDLKFNFLLELSSIGNNRAESCKNALQNLNPMVKVFSDNEPVSQKDFQYFSDKNFDLVCMLSDNFDEVNRVDKICRENGIMFLSGYVFGLYGFMFVDFKTYKYIVETPKISEENLDKKKSGQDPGCSVNIKDMEEKLVLQEKTKEFKSFDSFLNEYENILKSLKANKLKKFSKTYLIILLFIEFMKNFKRPFNPENIQDKENLLNLKKDIFDKLRIEQDLLSEKYLSIKNFNEFSPVNAILGGVISQEIIKAISKKNEPVENFFVFDGDLMLGEVIKI